MIEQFHRKQARKAELAAIFRGVRQAMHGTPNPLTLADLQLEWQSAPRASQVAYRLWFPDLCGITPEQAQKDRELFQKLAAEA